MILISKQIQQIYTDVYPDMEQYYAMPFSEEFYVPNFQEEIWPMYLKHSVKGISHIKNIRDCEKRAWKVVSDMQWQWGMQAEDMPEDKRITRSIGWLMGLKMPFGTPHTIITTYSDLGIRNIEPLTNMIDEVDINKFNALLLVM